MKRVVAVLALGLVSVLGGVTGAQTTADELVARANVKHNARDYSGCIADCDAAIVLDPDNSNAYCTRGLAKDRQANLDGALADYNKAIELDSRNSTAYCYRGLLKAGKHDLDGALADYDKAIELKPNDSLGYNARGYAKLTKRDFDGALADYDKIIELYPQLSTAYGNRGHCHFARGDYAAAAIDYRSCLSLRADDEEYALWLYLARRKSGEDGSPDLLKFGQKHGIANEWPASLFRLYVGSGTPDEVLAAAVAEGGTCEELCGVSPKKLDAYFYVGQWHLLRGERGNGVEFLKKSLAQDVPGFTPGPTIHWIAARAELERMGEIPPQK